MNTRIEEERLGINQIWEVRLECGCIIQLAQRNKEERENNGIKCPNHPNKYAGFIAPVYKKIVSIRKVRMK